LASPILQVWSGPALFLLGWSYGAQGELRYGRWKPEKHSSPSFPYNSFA
jgi:hypothetical protein